MIADVSPHNANGGKTVTLAIVGTNLQSARVVRLVRLGVTILGTEITTNPMMVWCQIKIDQGTVGDDWDLEVETEDGKQRKKRLSRFQRNPSKLAALISS